MTILSINVETAKLGKGVILFVSFFFFMLFTVNNFAQAPNFNQFSPEYSRQVGIDVSGLLSRFFNFSQSGSFDDPIYYFTYRKNKGEQSFRLAAGGDISIESQANGTNTDLLLNVKMGKEKHSLFAKRWSAYYGWDIKAHVLFRHFGASSDKTQIGLGFAPIAGLQFFLNERLSISAEVDYTLMAFVKNENGDTRGGALTSFTSPKAIYLNYRF
ncbi:MAG: hypothetical protein GY705_17570 [Bacteroidetes bacterium]|nr:hypothetical protein [Bacteroidota bacterium]